MRHDITTVSRRGFMGQIALASAAATIIRAPEFLTGSGWFATPHASAADVIHDTYNGLLAFVVPGRDDYSVAQGVSVPGPGGVEAGATDALIATIDASTPSVPQFSAFLATILNNIALGVNPGATGPFASHFARLSYPEKIGVFFFMDTQEPLKVIAGVLPAFVAFFAYSEAGVFDPATRTLTGRPLGWELSNYDGVSDGRNEFHGYLKGVPHA